MLERRLKSHWVTLNHPPKNNKQQKKRAQKRAQLVAQVRGQGAYSLSDVTKAVRAGLKRATGAVPKGAFKTAGTYLGNAAGGKLGGVLGGAAGDLISRITGFGDYMVNSNTIMSNTETIPTFSNNGDGIRIRHREFVKDIVGSSAFTTQLLPLRVHRILSCFHGCPEWLTTSRLIVSKGWFMNSDLPLSFQHPIRLWVRF